MFAINQIVKMRKLKNQILILLAVLCIMSCSKKETVLTIGVIPAQNQGNMKHAMDKLADYLNEETGVAVKMDIYADYNAVVEALNFGKIDLAYLGPLTYCIANSKSGAEAIITMLIKGKPYYHSYIITQKGSKYNNLDDLLADVSNVEFAFGDPNSTSGSLVPGVLLKDRKVFKDLHEHQFKKVVYTGGHDATALAVQHNKITAGAIDSAIFDILKDKGSIDKDAFKVIWKSDRIFQYPWTVRSGFDPEMKEKLRDAFVRCTDQEILDVFGADGFVKATDADYNAIRDVAKADGRI